MYIECIVFFYVLATDTKYPSEPPAGVSDGSKANLI